MKRRPFLTAEWRYLAMLNYEVDPAILLPMLPRGTELDTWNGRTHMSVVGFLFRDTRLLGLSVPFHRTFEEVNLRFYVRRWSGEEWRRGVVFVKELVPLWTIAFTARTFYNENYVALPMSHAIKPAIGANDITSVHYGWTANGRACSLEATADDIACDMTDGSEEEFIAQHYWGYARQRDGSTVEYEVEHDPWRRIWPCAPGKLVGDVASLYGPQFARYLQAAPSSSFIADGSAVKVHGGRRIQA